MLFLGSVVARLCAASLCLLLPLALANAPANNATSGPHCDCYLTNGSAPAFFSKHMFYDFRNLSQYAGIPAPISDAALSAAANSTSQYFLSDAWSTVWWAQNWNNSNTLGTPGVDAQYLLVNSPNNVYIEPDPHPSSSENTYLTLRTKRYKGFQSAAEIESVSADFQFLSMRFFARTLGARGGCSGLFTFRHSDTLADVQEADIEILTAGPPDVIQYSNQPSFTIAGDNIPASTRNVTIPNGLVWTDWAVLRHDWTPSMSTWYVDGEMVANISYQTPRDACQVVFNAWSDGGSWTGSMPLLDESYLQVKWLEIVYNMTSPNHNHRRNIFGRRSDAGCETVCSIDQVIVTGHPVPLWKGAATRLDYMHLTWLPALSIIWMLLIS